MRRSRQGCLRSQVRSRGQRYTPKHNDEREHTEHFARSPFIPPPKLKNAHAQTLAGTMIPRRFKAVLKTRAALRRGARRAGTGALLGQENQVSADACNSARNGRVHGARYMLHRGKGSGSRFPWCE
jgi:hypothetical protein